MKTCADCGKEKDEGEYSKSNSSKDGLERRCKKCVSRINRSALGKARTYIKKLKRDLASQKNKKLVGQMRHLRAKLGKEKERLSPFADKTLHQEIIGRTMVACGKLINAGIITFEEVVILLIGNQNEYFNRNDVAKGATIPASTATNRLNAMVEAGYLGAEVGKWKPKPGGKRKLIYYYITVEGRKRCEAILDAIFAERVGLKRIKKISKDRRRNEVTPKHLPIITDTPQG